MNDVIFELDFNIAGASGKMGLNLIHYQGQQNFTKLVSL